MRRTARWFLTWLLMAALPLPGWAMALQACHGPGGVAGVQAGVADGRPVAPHRHAAGPDGAPASHAAGSHAEGHAQGHIHAHGGQDHPHAAGHPAHHGADTAHPAAGPADPGSLAGPFHTQDAAGCSHCAACCTGGVPMSQAPAPAIEPAPPAPPAALPRADWPFLTDGPERPPRGAQA